MMPAQDDYRDAQYIASTHVCPDCGDKGRLVVRWNGKKDEAACGRCGRTDGFRKRESLTAKWRRDPESLPIGLRNKLEHKYGVEAMSEQSLAQATERAIVQRIEQARWLKELTPQDRTSLAHLSIKYGLDPLMKELTLYEGAPYISIAGLIRIAHRQKEFAGLEDRPMTSEERQQYGYKAPFCWIVKVYRSDWKCAATGTGTADPSSPFRNNPIERIRPEWMARSRAIRQALKLGFPHSMPFDEVGDAEERGIDPETGEILAQPQPTLHVVQSAAREIFGEADEVRFGDEAAPDAAPVEADTAASLAKIDNLVAQLRWNRTGFEGKFADKYGMSLREADAKALAETIALLEAELAKQAAK